MSRSALGRLAFLIPWALAGCDSGGFAPPPPAGLSSTGSPSLDTAIKSIDLILVSERTTDRQSWAQIFRRKAGNAKVLLRVSAPDPADPPAKQADLIRDAVERGTSVLVVEPAESPKVVEALNQARADGVPVLLLAHAVKAEKPFPVVEYSPSAESAKTLVAAAFEDAKKAGLAADGSAMLLSPRQHDASTRDHVDALARELDASGVKTVERIEIDVEHDQTGEASRKTLMAFARAHPKLTLVLGDSHQILSWALDVRSSMVPKQPYMVAGYVGNLSGVVTIAAEQCAALADGSVPELASEAFDAALRLAEGKVVDDHIEIPVPVQRYSSRTVESMAPPTGAEIPK